MNLRILIVLILFAVPVSVRSANLVVWDFAYRNGTTDDITRNLTYEFEEALTKPGKFKILDRRTFARLQAVIDNEKALRQTGRVSSTTISSLRGLGADTVVFGDVFDDIDSGEISITATFQDFQGAKILIRSVQMPRGRVRDASSRREAVTSLVDAIIGTSTSTQTTARKIHRVESNGFIFDLETCTLAARSVQCRFTVTNNGENRLLYIIHNTNYGYAGKWQPKPDAKTVLYDEFSNEASLVRAQLASSATQEGRRSVVGAKLISGRPAEALIRFESVASKATIASSLEISCVDDETGEVFVVEFKNVELATK